MSFAKRVRVLLLVLAVSAASWLTSSHAQAPTGPPGPRVEAPPPSPAPDAVWLAGHWDWRGNAWVWQAGHWEKSQGRFYIPGRYRQTPQGWVYEPGRWQH